MENYELKKVVYAHEDGPFKSYHARRKENGKYYLLTIYYLKNYNHHKEEICNKILELCINMKHYRCSEVFFDHKIHSLKSIRPSNVGFLIKEFVVVEPLPMVSLSDYFDSANIQNDTVITGFSNIYHSISTLHYSDIGYGCLSPLNIIVSDNNFSLRPPNLMLFPCSCSPPPVVSRPDYRLSTEIEHYPHSFNSNKKTNDLICFGYLLCDYIIYHGRNISFQIQKDFPLRDKNFISQKFSLPKLIIDFLLGENDLFCDETIEFELRRFLLNRRTLLKSYNMNLNENVLNNSYDQINGIQDEQNNESYREDILCDDMKSNSYFLGKEKQHQIEIKMRFEYNNKKYFEKSFDIQLDFGELKFRYCRMIKEMKHHHQTFKVSISSSDFNLCLRKGISIKVRFNEEVKNDDVHLDIRNVSIIPFHHHSTRIFSVQIDIKPYDHSFMEET